MTYSFSPSPSEAICLNPRNGGHPEPVVPPPRDMDLSTAELILKEPSAGTWKGFGICFNECGWEALSHLPAADLDDLLRDLFQTGAFPRCRMPIGANDYALSWYSPNETDGDFEMDHFTLDRDRLHLIPYIRAAMRYEPELTLFASPWSPPTWMKSPPVYNYGTLRWEPEVRKAYARYFHRFVTGMRAEGIPVTDLHVQNEPDSNQKFPSCVWTGLKLRDFIRDDIGPLFAAEPPGGEPCGIWLGTIERSDYDAWVAPTLHDPEARRFVAGAGFQWAGRGAVEETHQNWPDLPLAQTENVCGNGQNDWGHAMQVFRLVREYLHHGVRAYCYWNFVLGHPTGRSTWGWDQNSMVTVDPEQGTYRLNPEYHLLRLLGECAPPGSILLRTDGSFASHALAFLSEGRVRVAVRNPFDHPVRLVVRQHDGTRTVVLPADTVTAFNVGDD